MGHHSILTTARYTHLIETTNVLADQLSIDKWLDESVYPRLAEGQMILLSSIIQTFEAEFLATYDARLLPSQ